ncbi:MAG: helix-turn-helix transcriptional regulator [Gemmatimonadales bacterium]
MRHGLGEFEQLLLLALVNLPESERYGVPIRAYLEACADRRATAGAVYTALDRLARRGLVTSALGEATAERGGRASASWPPDAGRGRELAQSVRAVQALSRGVLPARATRVRPRAAEVAVKRPAGFPRLAWFLAGWIRGSAAEEPRRSDRGPRAPSGGSPGSPLAGDEFRRAGVGGTLVG